MPTPRSQAISAYYLSHLGDQLTFVSRFRPRQQALSLTLNVGDEDLRMDVLLQQARQTHKGDFICQVEILNGAEQLSLPKVPGGALQYARSSHRTAARLRALSPDLPNFRALSVDVSGGGLRLETEAALAPNFQLKLSLDLDIPDQEPIPLKCRVVWCKPVGRTFEVGLRFLEIEPWISPLLASFQSWLDGTGLKPKAYSPIEDISSNPSEPAPKDEAEVEPPPPAGSIPQAKLLNKDVELILSWRRGEVFRVLFRQVLVFRDNRGVEGEAFHDALDLEESTLLTQGFKVLPASLDTKRELFHYQFLNHKERPIMEILCSKTADYYLVQEGP